MHTVTLTCIRNVINKKIMYSTCIVAACVFTVFSGIITSG